MGLANKQFINILGVKTGVQSLPELIEFIAQSINANQKVVIQYLNIHAINLAQKHPWFKSFLNQADMTYCDGYGLRLAARILGVSLPDRYTIPDWFPELAAHCNQNGHSIYILGARPGVAEIAAENLQIKAPGLKILGTYHGYFIKELHSSENQRVIAMINQANPDILAIGFGMPLQEKWLLDNWGGLNCRVAIPMGAAIDYLAGKTPRAPRWLTDHGLEWLGRLVIEPRRLWKRYLLGIPFFYYNVLKQRLGYYTHR